MITSSEISVLSSSGDTAATLFRLRLVLSLFIVALVLSGLTAFPLQRELEIAASMRGLDRATHPVSLNGADSWILTVRDGLQDTYAHYPWIAYGTDWLALAHIVIALFFLGPLFDPVRNTWILWVGLAACAFVIPLALICGRIRSIPLGWRLIDCSFGVVGAIPLWYCLRLAGCLERNVSRSSRREGYPPQPIT